ncbi:hypothetical protein [Litorisediminicola beolgyonensis]|uniref:Flagellar protein FliL n=1 Tax=Litorisediminicola beolgyonensis TaxID=1173614 RepID=A0ABW3ZFW8_9RHOB
MSKLTILLAGLPVLSVGLGFGAGYLLDPSGSDAHSSAALHADAPAAQDGVKPTAGKASGHAPVTAKAHAPAATADHGGDGDVIVQSPTKAKEVGPGIKPELDGRVIMLGRITLPVQKARSVSYIVADLGVALPDPQIAESYSSPETAMRLRDAVLTELTKAAGGPDLKGASIDTDALSDRLRSVLAQSYADVEDVLFLSFYKADVPRV